MNFIKKYYISINSLLIISLMFVMTFLSYVSIKGIPLYIFFMSFIYIKLLINNEIQFKFTKIEMELYIYIVGFIIFLLIQYFIYQKFSILLSMAGFIAGLGLIFLLRNALNNIRDILFVIEIYIIFQAFIGIIAIIQAFTGSLYPPIFNINFHINLTLLNGVWHWHRPQGVDGMIYSFAKNYIFPVIFLFISLKYEFYKYNKFLTKQKIIFLLLFFIFIIILSQTRSTQLSIFTMFLGYVFYKYQLYKPKFIILGLSIISIIILFIITHLNLFIDKSTETRFILWLAGYKMFLTHPLIGVGMGEFGDIYEKIKNTIHIQWIGNDYYRNIYSPHNLFVGLLSETGIIGTFIILTAFYKILKYLKNYEFDDIKFKIVALSVFYYFIAFLIDFQFHNYWNDNYYWFWIGIGVSIIWIDQKMKNQLINFINSENKN